MSGGLPYLSLLFTPNTSAITPMPVMPERLAHSFVPVHSVTENSGVKSSIKPPPPPVALEVDDKNYHKLINSGKDVLVAFTAPWVSWG